MKPLIMPRRLRHTQCAGRAAQSVTLPMALRGSAWPISMRTGRSGAGKLSRHQASSALAAGAWALRPRKVTKAFSRGSGKSVSSRTVA